MMQQKEEYGRGDYYLVFPRCPHDEFPYVLRGEFADVDEAIDVASDIVRDKQPVGIDDETGEVVHAGDWCKGNFIVAEVDSIDDPRLAYTARFLDLSLPNDV